MLEQAKNWSLNNFDWLVMISGNFFVLFCLLLIVLPWGESPPGRQHGEARVLYLCPGSVCCLPPAWVSA